MADGNSVEMNRALTGTEGFDKERMAKHISEGQKSACLNPRWLELCASEEH